ncbi:MAG: hypothetical protein HYW03_10410 [Deltaproteobacteria bacterium]|nr:hypothetical protein [Deltaproteobacteria bacterium]MBI2532606.1 hypothetical protein [Deltaproteobacteria bacterium]MBI3065286.1 hypothetical protein [Deltaproteobacteria bacterium]
MKKISNQAPIVRYRASVSEIFFPDSWNWTFSAESIPMQDPSHNRNFLNEASENAAIRFIGHRIGEHVLRFDLELRQKS